MYLDDVDVVLGLVVYDDAKGAGTVTRLNTDSFEVTFGPSVVLTYFGNGLLAGRKMLHAERPFIIYPTPEQMTMVRAVLAAMYVRTN